MTTKYYALLTNQGAAKLANATALGTKLQITEMAVGDGGGALPTPDASQTKLIGEKRRAALNSLSVDAANSSQIIAEQIIPENEGGFWIREIGLFDADGVMIAVANCAETYKPQLQEGSGRTQTVRMIIIVNSAASVTLKIDPSVVLATRQYVDDAAIEVKAYADDLMAKHIAAADPHKQYAPKESPIFTGAPKAPTPVSGNSTTLIATTAFVQEAIARLVDSAPAGLDTLNELANALGDDPDFATTITNQIASRALIAGNVNQQFFVKDSTADGHAVNRGQMNTALALRALLTGSVSQKFWVMSAPADSNAAVPVSLLNDGLNKKANLNGNDQTDFYVRNNGETNAAVNNARLNFVLGNYAYKGGDANQGFAVAGGNNTYSAVAYGQFQSGVNGNGAWTKLPGGGQWCRQNLNISSKSSFSWTFPAAFGSTPAVFISAINGDPAVWCAGVGAQSAILYNNNDTTLNVNVLAIW